MEGFSKSKQVNNVFVVYPAKSFLQQKILFPCFIGNYSKAFCRNSNIYVW